MPLPESVARAAKASDRFDAAFGTDPVGQRNMQHVIQPTYNICKRDRSARRMKLIRHPASGTPGDCERSRETLKDSHCNHRSTTVSVSRTHLIQMNDANRRQTHGQSTPNMTCTHISESPGVAAQLARLPASAPVACVGSSFQPFGRSPSSQPHPCASCLTSWGGADGERGPR